MTPIEKRILENQKWIMVGLNCLLELNDFKQVPFYLKQTIKKTEDMTFEESNEEPCCEMPERIQNYQAKHENVIVKTPYSVIKFAKSKDGEEKK